MPNKAFVTAIKSKSDEFYTQIEDIELEMKGYKPHFRNKIVYCNCDDPRESNFFEFFRLKFGKYQLKKLITTCYKSKDSTLFTDNSSNQSVGRTFDGERDLASRRR